MSCSTCRASLSLDDDPGARPEAERTGACRIAICNGCGIRRGSARTTCETCHAEYTEPALYSLKQPRDGTWIAVRLAVPCEGCGLDVSLTHFDLAKALTCEGCGLEQHVDAAMVSNAVAFANAVDDLPLGGGQPSEPIPHVWVTEGRRQASRGNPLCRRCKVPYVVLATRGGVMQVGCSACGDRRRYALPAHALDLFGLTGALADEHEIGARESTTDEEQEPTPTKTWWLYFEEARESRPRDEERATPRRAPGGSPYRGGDTPDVIEATPPAPRAPSGGAEAKRGPLRFAFLAVVVGVGLMAVGAGLIAATAMRRHQGSTAKDRALMRYSFAMSADSASDLFGTDVEEGVVQFESPGVFEVAGFGDRRRADYSLELTGGDRFNPTLTHERLALLFPRLRRPVGGVDRTGDDAVSSGGATLTVVYAPGACRASIHARGIDAADAMLSALRYAAMEGPELSPAQLRLIKGPPLSKVAEFDVRVTAWSAEREFFALFPGGGCGAMSEPGQGRHKLVCEGSVDDPMVREVRFVWTDLLEPKAPLESVGFLLPPEARASPGMMRCLDGRLRHPRGSAHGLMPFWPLGERGGGLAIDGDVLAFEPARALAPGQAPEWHAHFRGATLAIAKCAK